eukprot:CAMPEP_0172474200 /NCGR_PEP_ID=MMETSP1065-20121228/69237_1 /TAXON_ID=265537 /ORGANISM="Amphiprora paludosa, Strain CCMP125" /LENGTH=620 /DNA_ID=CAMNT_0013232379 /DNA_START=5 /DNA_END=1867 /DNA_ORIENTATION=+
MAPSLSPTQSPTTAVPTIPPTVLPTESCNAPCNIIPASLSNDGLFAQGTISLSGGIGSCSFPKDFPGISSPGTQTPFTPIGPFCNDSPSNACATIKVDIGTCLFGFFQGVNVAAYDSLFDPSDLSSGYLGDLSTASSPTGLGEFEVNVESFSRVYVVGLFTNVAPPIFLPCDFTISVDFGSCSTPEPAPTSLPTTAPSESPTTKFPTVLPTTSPTQSPTVTSLALCERFNLTFSDADGIMDGRVVRNGTIPSTCATKRPFPGVFGSFDRFFNVLGPFRNTEPVERCATLKWDFGSCFFFNQTSNETDVLIHATVYSSFDPTNLASGYISDIGSSDAPEFSFLVPGQSDFEFVAQEVIYRDHSPGGAALGCQYSLEVQFDDCPTMAPSLSPTQSPTTSMPTINPTAPPTTSNPTTSPTVRPTSLSPTQSPSTTAPTFERVPLCENIPSVFVDNGERMSGRLRRDGDSTCEVQKPYPGRFGNFPTFFNVIGPFVNDESTTRCATLFWDYGNCTAAGEVLLHPSVYSSFNRSNLEQGYIADSGADNVTSFSFNIPPDSQFEFVAQEVLPFQLPSFSGLVVGCFFSIRVEFEDCLTSQDVDGPLFLHNQELLCQATGCTDGPPP